MVRYAAARATERCLRATDSQFYEPDVFPEFEIDGKTAKASIKYYEVLEPKIATTLASFSNIAGTPPAVTVNKFGKGQAIYLAAPAQPSLIGPIVRSLFGSLGIQRGPETGDGVYARVVDGRTLYVNTTKQEKRVPIVGKRKGLLCNRVYDGAVVLGAFEADLVE